MGCKYMHVLFIYVCFNLLKILKTFEGCLAKIIANSDIYMPNCLTIFRRVLDSNLFVGGQAISAKLSNVDFKSSHIMV